MSDTEGLGVFLPLGAGSKKNLAETKKQVVLRRNSVYLVIYSIICPFCHPFRPNPRFAADLLAGLLFSLIAFSYHRNTLYEQHIRRAWPQQRDTQRTF